MSLSKGPQTAAVPELRLVLVGLSGVGKSAAGNTILGRETFLSEISSSSVTLMSEERQGEVCGRRVTVVDTPGLFNTELSGERLREEMKRCVSLCYPGPHAFLLVIQLGRFTEQEKSVMETLQELFSKRVNQYTVVLFSYGDKLRNTTIDQFIRADKNLQQLLEKCGGHYHVFNNEDMCNTNQVNNLFVKIDNMMLTKQEKCFNLTKDRTHTHISSFENTEKDTVVKVISAAAPPIVGGAVGALVGLALGPVAVAVGAGIGLAAGLICTACIYMRCKTRRKTEMTSSRSLV